MSFNPCDAPKTISRPPFFNTLDLQHGQGEKCDIGHTDTERLIHMSLLKYFSLFPMSLRNRKRSHSDAFHCSDMNIQLRLPEKLYAMQKLTHPTEWRQH